MRTYITGRSLLFALTLIICTVIGLAASPFATAQATEGQGKRIAYLVPGLDLPFWRYFAQGIKDEAAKHDASVTVYDSHNDASTQLKNIQDAIARGVDGIVLSPTTSSAAPSVLRAAKRASIPVVIGDIGTTSGDYVSFITSENRHGAYETGKALASALKDKGWDTGPVGLVTISLARNNGQARTAGFRQAMKDAGIKEVAINQMQTYTAGETFKYVQDMLAAHPDMHGIFVETDTPTLGAVRAIQANRSQDTVLLAAFDGVPEYVNLLKSGRIVVAGMQQPHLMGVRAAQAMFDHIAGKTPKKEALVPVKIVTKNNLEKVLPTIKRTVFANTLK